MKGTKQRSLRVAKFLLWESDTPFRPSLFAWQSESYAERTDEWQ